MNETKDQIPAVGVHPVVRAERPCHCLKTWPEYFQAVWDGVKIFEVRKNDRDFQAEDFVTLKEWNPESETYTGREIDGRIGYVLHGGPSLGLKDGFCVFSFRWVHRNGFIPEASPNVRSEPCRE